jgi:hypothetical protein
VVNRLWLHLQGGYYKTIGLAVGTDMPPSQGAEGGVDRADDQVIPFSKDLSLESESLHPLPEADS